MKAWAKTPYNSDILIVLCVLLGGGCNTTHTNIIAAAPANICTTGASLINPSAAPGLGGTGQIAGLPTSNALEQIEKRSGVGGTGRPETLAKGGVGGTGIVGVVTGFASICVNGVEVHFSRSTPIMVDGEHGSASELLVGQVVVIRATGAMNDSNAQLQAQQIFVQHAAVGPLTQVDAETGMFEVMGQPAQALTKKDLSNLRPGDWVRVSGHRLAEGTIRASHVQGLASPLPTAQILGFVTDIKGSAVWIGGTKVQFKTLPAGLSLGSEIAVNGRWNANQLEVLSNSLQPTRSELGVVNDVVLQGYVRTLHGRELTLGYESLLLSDRVRITGGKAEALQVNQPVQI